MMSPIGWLALLLLWVLFYWLYRDYRLDYFRQKLFGLRDELFDLASEGHIDFASPAYGMLRSMINGTIQFGHQLSILEILFSAILVRRDSTAEQMVADFGTKWTTSIAGLDSETQAKLKSIRARLHQEIALHLIFTSAVLTSTVLALFAGFVVTSLKKAAVKRLDAIIENSRVRRLFSRMDCTASINAT